MALAEPKPDRPLALVLKGGGVKGLALAGALEELEKHYSFDVFVGTSAGGIAAVLLAAGYSAQELKEILWNKDFREFLDRSPFSKLWNLVHGGLHSGKPVRDWVRRLLKDRIDLESGVEMADLPKRAVLFASNERDGTVIFDTEGDNSTAPADFAVRCSMSIPYYFRPERHEGADIFDGGLLNNFPLNAFLEDNGKPDFLALYLASDPSISGKRWRPLRLMSILLDRGELTVVDEHRDRVIVINPLPVRTTQFDLGELEKKLLLAAGRAAALEYLAAAKPEAVTQEEALRAKTEAEELRARARQAAQARRRRKAILPLLLLIVGVLAIAWTYFSSRNTKDQTPPVVEAGAPERAPAAGVRAPVQPQPRLSVPPAIDFAAMPEEELRSWVGQVFLVGFQGRSMGPSGPVQRLIQEKVGGILLFSHNIPSGKTGPERRRGLIEFISAMQQAAREQTGMPLIVAADQEGGSVQALGPGVVTEMPAAMALGGLRRRSEAREAARLIGSELRALGLNVNLAPVADVNTNSGNDLIRDRSFGGHWSLVRAMASAWLEGAEEAGILSVVKHFPGHGSTEEGIESDGVPISKFSSVEFIDSLRPFRELVELGADAIMTSHFDPVNISGTTVTFDPGMIDLLRQTGPKRFKGTQVDGLGFEGLVLTDDLDMPSVTYRAGVGHYEALRDGVERAFLAGHDVLMLGNVFPDGTKPEAMRSAEKGKLPKGITLGEFTRLLEDFERFVFDEGSEVRRRERVERLRESLQRVAEFKAKLPPENIGIERRRETLEKQWPEHIRTAQRLFRASLSVIPSNEGFPSFDLDKNETMLIVFGTRWSHEGIEDRKRKGEYKGKVEKERDAHHVPREIFEKFKDRTRIILELEAQYPKTQDFDSRAEVLARLVRGENPRLILFVINNIYQAEQLAHILNRLSRVPGFDLHDVVVIVTAHPNLLAPFARNPLAEDLSAKISYVFAYTGERQTAAEMLADELSRLEPGGSLGEAGPPPMVIDRLNNSPEWTTQ